MFYARGYRVLFGVVVMALLAATVWAFLFFDKDSHSASDTLRPFLITVVPLWAVGIGGTYWLATSRGRRQ